MAKPQNMDKIVMAIVATLVALTALGLTVVGSFIPNWARPLNSSNTEANSTFSLWYREDCFGIICRTKYRTVLFENKRTWTENGKKQTKFETFTKMEPVTTCVVANYCNKTWFDSDVEFSEVPSLLFVARAFLIPSYIAGTICVLIYIIKILMLVLRPAWRRLHVKAAYLTFAAVAGVSCGVGVIIFVVMLEEESFELMWAPALPGVGGILYLLIALGGYLSWRSHSTDEEFDACSDISGSDRTSGMYEFSPSGKGRAAPPSSLEENGRQVSAAHPDFNHHTQSHRSRGLQQPDRKLSKGHVHGRHYQRSASEPFGKAEQV